MTAISVDFTYLASSRLRLRKKVPANSKYPDYVASKGYTKEVSLRRENNWWITDMG